MLKKDKIVAYWLIAGVLMIIIQTLLGGITRLTGSGLSITEWKPLLGTLPPLNEQEWQKAFDGYKQIGQYKLLNYQFTLDQFKSIFFWEWFHREWARLLFVVFAIGFGFFLWKGYLNKKMVKPFLILGLLGGLQGLIGWLMVKTGLNSEDVHVHYIALSVHFISAMVLACYTLWFALKLLVPEGSRVVSPKLVIFTAGLILLTFLQLTYGSFMAGIKAANVAPTWPTINGVYMPNTVFTKGFVKDPDIAALKLNIQFSHRTLAYLLVLVLLPWFYYASKASKHTPIAALSNTKWAPLALVLLQVTLGVFTVLTSVQYQPCRFGTFEVFAELHQLVAMFLLMALLVNLFVVKRG